MHAYNKHRGRLTLSSKEKFLLGPQFMLQASATAVQERPQIKVVQKDSTSKSNESLPNPYSAIRSRPLSYGDTSSLPNTEQQTNLVLRQGSSSSTSRRAYRVATTFAQDFGAGVLTGASDADRNSIYGPSGSSSGRNLSSYLPGDKVVFSEKSIVPGVPAVYRTAEEKASNPDRLNLDRRRLTVCPLLEGEDQLRLLNYQHNTIQHIEHLDSLTRLIFLDFYDNQIERISGLDCLRSLRVLMLGKNRIKVIENLDALTKLDVLDLHGNQIKVIENLNHLSDLRVLNLAGNLIEDVKNLAGLDLLTELNLRRNKIHTVLEIDTLPNLQRLFLSFNSIASFDDISCVADSCSLSELALDSNPIAQELNYKQTVLRHALQLKQLDMKRITEDERRIATVMGRKEEEKKRENSKMAILVEKRRRTIHNARQQWEQMINARNDHQGKRKTMPDLYATHVATVPNRGVHEGGPIADHDGANSDSSSLSSPRSTGENSEKEKNVVNANVRPKSSGPVLRTTASCVDSGFQHSHEKENRSFHADHLSEIEGETLNLYGPGSLDAFDKSWGLQAAGSVTTVCFHFIDFDHIAKILSKIRVRFPNVNTLIFSSTNIQSFVQLNALSTVRRLDNLIIEPDGNPVTNLSLWRTYVIFRLAHFNLKKVNGKEVSVSDVVGAEKYFAALANVLSSNLPQARLMLLLGDRKKQLLIEDKAKNTQTEAFKAPSNEKTEPVGRVILAYTASENQAQKLQDAKLRHNFLQTYLQSITSSAIQADQKLSTLNASWVDILSNFVCNAVIEMWDEQIYGCKCMEELEKTRLMNQREAKTSNTPQSE